MPTDRPSRDWTLHSGERQTAQDFSGVRKDHTNRYTMASSLLVEHLRGTDKERSFGLDVFCGTGYGTAYLSDALGGCVLGIDGSADAIGFAGLHYASPGAYFCHRVFPFRLPVEVFDFVVCFESLEHVPDDEALIREICGSLANGGLFFLSVPNESLQPLEKNRAAYKFHFRHYRHDAFLERMTVSSPELSLCSWFGQDVYHFNNEGTRLGPMEETRMTLHAGVEGQFLIYVFQKRHAIPAHGFVERSE